MTVEASRPFLPSIDLSSVNNYRIISGAKTIQWVRNTGPAREYVVTLAQVRYSEYITCSGAAGSLPAVGKSICFRRPSVAGRNHAQTEQSNPIIVISERKTLSVLFGYRSASDWCSSFDPVLSRIAPAIFITSTLSNTLQQCAERLPQVTGG